MNLRAYDQQSATAFSATTTSGYSHGQAHRPRQLFVNIPMPEERLDPYALSAGHYRPSEYFVSNQ